MLATKVLTNDPALSPEATVIGVVYAVRPMVRAACTGAITSATSVCDTNGFGVYNETCAVGTVCLPGTANNGGCGSSSTCIGQSYNIARSGDGNRIEILGDRFGYDPTKLSVRLYNSDSSSQLSLTNVVWASDSLLVVDTPSTAAFPVGSMHATVIHSTNGASGNPANNPMHIGSVESALAQNPQLEPAALKLNSSSSVLDLQGSHFGTVASDLRVYLTPSNLATGVHNLSMVSGNVMPSAAVAATGFTAQIIGLENSLAGRLFAVVARQGVKSDSAQVATVAAKGPWIQHSDFLVAHSSAGNWIEIRGGNFGWDVNKLTVQFTPTLTLSSPALISTMCNDTALVVHVQDTSAVALFGPLLATVSHQLHGSSGSATRIGSITTSRTPGAGATLTSVQIPILSQSSELVISGTNFGVASDSASHVRVYFTPIASPRVLGTVKPLQFSATSFTVALQGLDDLQQGLLYAQVSIMGVVSSAAVVANVTAVRPVLTIGSFQIAQSSIGSVIEIHGHRFGQDTSALSINFIPALGACSVLRIVDISPNPIDHLKNPAHQRIDVTCTNVLNAPQGPVSSVVLHTTYGDSGSPVVVGSVAPTITTPSLNSALNLRSAPSKLATFNLDMNGQSFGSSSTDVRVYLKPASGRHLEAQVSSVTSTTISITVGSLWGMTDGHVGILQAQVTVKGVPSAWVNVAQIIPVAPSLTSSHFKVSRFPNSSVIELKGARFGVDKAQISVTLEPSLGTITIQECRNNLIVVEVNGDTRSSAIAVPSELKATVAHSIRGSWPMVSNWPGSFISAIGASQWTDSYDLSPVHVGELVELHPAPIITASPQSIISTENKLTINGRNFGASVEDLRVYLHASNGISPTATVEEVSDNIIVVVLHGLSDANVGLLNADVTVLGRTSSTSAVGDVILAAPLVGAICKAITGSSSTCDSNGNGVYTDVCAIGMLCNPTASSPCGSASYCVGRNFQISKSLAGNRIEIRGRNFGEDKSKVTVTLTPAVALTLVSCTANLIVCDIANTSMLSISPGQIFAKVVHSQHGSGNINISGTVGEIVIANTPAQIGLVVSSITSPVVTAAATSLRTSKLSFNIHGQNFGYVHACPGL